MIVTVILNSRNVIYGYDSLVAAVAMASSIRKKYESVTQELLQEARIWKSKQVKKP